MLAELFVFCVLTLSSTNGNAEYTTGQFELGNRRHPTIMVAILVRNKAHTLPYFLNYFERLNYPKDRMALW